MLGLADNALNEQQAVYSEFNKQLVRSEEGWYETGLPWEGNRSSLPSNKHGSLQRLLSLTRKLHREERIEQYNNIIREQRVQRIIEKADKPAQGVEFYIPHKPVVQENAEPTKMCIVYDASARAHQSAPSLNNCLNAGPPLQNKLWNLLIGQRSYPVAVTRDLKNAFLQVPIKEQDRNALRFHWRKDKNSELETLRFTRILFGLTCSPFLLGGVIEYHLGMGNQRSRSWYQSSESYIEGKVIFRDVCDKKQACDAKLTGPLLQRWHKWEESLPLEVSVPRSITSFQEPLQDIELHSFGDGSNLGVGTAVYAVVKQVLGTTQRLVAAKVRLAKEGLSIPCLELVAGHMATNLLTNVKSYGGITYLARIRVVGQHCCPALDTGRRRV